MILYGVPRVFIQEIDPTTWLPPATGGATHRLSCSEELAWTSVVEDAEETVKRCPSTNAIMGDRRIPESLYGYTITLTENEWDMGLYAFLNGMETVETGGEVVAAYTPPITEGMTFKPFRLIAFSYIYEGADVIGYAVFIFNKCQGTITDVTLGQDFVSIAYEIEAREASSAGLPLHSVGFYDEVTPPDSLAGLNIVSGVLRPSASRMAGAVTTATITKTDTKAESK